MKISLQHIAAAILLIISLVMPLACDAARMLVVDSAPGVHVQLQPDISDGGCPCPECPSDHHCECDCCSSYAPLFQSLVIDYSPTLGSMDFFSINTKPPQVYFSIFVPPQNLAG